MKPTQTFPRAVNTPFAWFCVPLILVLVLASCSKTADPVVSANLIFKNTTFTAISFSGNGSTQSIQPGSSITIPGKVGQSLSYTASTSGSTSSGTVLGETMTWSGTKAFAAGDQTTELYVSGDFFYLKIVNNSGFTYGNLFVNYGLVSQTNDNISIPSDGVKYTIGYYKAFSNSNARMSSGTSVASWSNLGLTFTTNQTVTLEIAPGGGGGGTGTGTGTGGTGTGTGSGSGTGTTTTLTFSNPTFTVITITLGGSTKTIPVGGTAVFTGAPGSSTSYHAETSGKTTSGTQVGLLMTWDATPSFPTSGNTTTNLVVTSTFFYLYVTNNSSKAITKLLVNYQLVSQTNENLTINNGGVKYGLGYYKAFTNSNIRAEAGTTFWSWTSMNLSFTNNQSYHAVAN